MMNVNEIFERIHSYIFDELLAGVGIEQHTLTQNAAAVLVVTMLLGLLLGFLGWKIVRVWAAIAGFFLGFSAGVFVSALAGIGGNGILIAGLVAAIVFAVFGAVLYRAGVFLVILFSVFSLCIQIIDPQSWIVLILCLLIALAAAILSIRYVAVLTILATGIYGASVAGNALYGLLPLNGELIRVIIFLILAAGGIAVQLLLESKKQKTASLKKAEQIREERSAANDVERARAVIENLDRDKK